MDRSSDVVTDPARLIGEVASCLRSGRLHRLQRRCSKPIGDSLNPDKSVNAVLVCKGRASTPTTPR